MELKSNIELTTSIKVIDKDIIKTLGQNFYTEDYLKLMMHREYLRGLKDGGEPYYATSYAC